MPVPELQFELKDKQGTAISPDDPRVPEKVKMQIHNAREEARMVAERAVPRGPGGVFV